MDKAAFDNVQTLTSILNELNAGWWIRDDKSKTFSFSDFIRELTGLDSNAIQFHEYIGMVREDYRDRISGTLSISGSESSPEKIYPIVTKNGTIWIKTKTIERKNDEEGLVYSTGYLQAIENPEIVQSEKASSLRTNNLLFQLNNISKILLTFLQSDDPDKVIHDILKDMLKQFKAGRTYIFEYDWPNCTQTNTYEAVDDNVKPEIDILSNLPFEMNTWWTEQMSQGNHIILSTLDDLPPEAQSEKEFLAFQEINSLYVAPLMSKDGVWGYAGVDIVDGFHTWTEEDCQWLSALINIISFCIQLQRSENRAQRDKNYLQSLYKNMPLGYMRLQVLHATDNGTGDFLYLDVNDAADKLFNQSLTDCIAQKASESINCFGKDMEELYRLFEGNSHLDIEYYIGKSDRYARLIAYSIHKDEVICLFSDITDAYHSRQILIEAKEKAEVNDRLKSAFLANMSHEIRTPLNAIVGFSDLLTQCEDLEERETYSKIVHENNELLLQLISDILDISKIEAGTLDIVYNHLDVNQLCLELMRFYHIKTEESEVKVSMKEYMPSCILMSDKNRIKQILSNFINNALKFTSSGHISVGYHLVDDKTIKFYVKDTGTGIPEDKREKIFNRFTKLDSFTSGTGLGLAISKSLVEQMGGEIGVESEVGKGSCFWFTHPYRADIQNNIVANKSIVREEVLLGNIQTESGKQPVILVAEDTDSNFFLLTSALRNKFKLLRAYTGVEAVELFKEESPDLILMDVKMPVMDGIEATRIIRKTNSTIPIIAVTAYAFESDKDDAFSAGCTDYMSKPISISDLIVKMGALIGDK